MNKIFLLILITCIFTSCNYASNKKSVIDVENKVDTIQKDSHIASSYNKIEAHKEDSICLCMSNSLKEVLKDIKSKQNISMTQRINRIKTLRHLIGIDGIWYFCSGKEDFNDYNLLATEIGFLLADTNIVNYNIDSIFATIRYNADFSVAHSEDNRLWVISFCISENGNGTIPANVIAWRDTYNRPQGFMTSYSAFSYLDCLIWWDEIYKLNDTLYLMLGGSKGCGNNAIIVELTDKGINLKYKGFATKGDHTLVNSEKSINGKVTVYNLGIDADSDENNYKFNNETKTINFRKTCQYYMDSKMDTLTIGTLTFNGKYFTEKLKKEKIEN